MKWDLLVYLMGKAADDTMTWIMDVIQTSKSMLKLKASKKSQILESLIENALVQYSLEALASLRAGPVSV